MTSKKETPRQGGAGPESLRSNVDTTTALRKRVFEAGDEH
jgi:hypothetical protein